MQLFVKGKEGNYDGHNNNTLEKYNKKLIWVIFVHVTIAPHLKLTTQKYPTVIEGKA